MRFLQKCEADIRATDLPSTPTRARRLRNLICSTGSRSVRFIYHRCEWVRTNPDTEDDIVAVDSTFMVAPMVHEERTTFDAVVVHRHHEKGKTPVWTCAKDSTKSRHCDHVKRVKSFLKSDDRTNTIFTDVESEDVAASMAAGARSLYHAAAQVLIAQFGQRPPTSRSAPPLQSCGSDLCRTRPSVHHRGRVFPRTMLPG